jgi:hypothetical protein
MAMPELGDQWGCGEQDICEIGCPYGTLRIMGMWCGSYFEWLAVGRLFRLLVELLHTLNDGSAFYVSRTLARLEEVILVITELLAEVTSRFLSKCLAEQRKGVKGVACFC